MCTYLPVFTHPSGNAFKTASTYAFDRPFTTLHTGRSKISNKW
jgi:hypothetical protein